MTRPTSRQALVASILLTSLASVSAISTCDAAENPLIIGNVTPKTTCKRPTQVGDEISVNYAGTLQSDGTKFDSSYDRGVPFTFSLGKHMVIDGWDKGLLNMCVGDRRNLTIAPEMGYGAQAYGPIPSCATLHFETELMAVLGVPVEDTKPKIEEVPDEGGEKNPGLETAPLTDTNTGSENSTSMEEAEEQQSPPEGSEEGPMVEESSNGECKLLGPFALIVQGALGLVALLSLVFKRWRERPRRPVKIWFFDASKQVVGSALLHVVNVAVSTISSGAVAVAAKATDGFATSGVEAAGEQPNPCSFYLLNLGIDTTIGIPVLVICLKVLHKLFSYTALANPPESIKSGHYGQPPHVSWWIKQCFIYFIGLLGMKAFVYFLFAALPWLKWVGDWALRWTEGNESLQIAFVMFIFPLAMNAIQYYIVDNFIKGKEDGGEDQQGYDAVQNDEDSDDDIVDERRQLRPSDDDDLEEEDKRKSPLPRVRENDSQDRAGSSSRGSTVVGSRESGKGDKDK